MRIPKCTRRKLIETLAPVAAAGSGHRSETGRDAAQPPRPPNRRRNRPPSSPICTGSCIRATSWNSPMDGWKRPRNPRPARPNRRKSRLKKNRRRKAKPFPRPNPYHRRRPSRYRRWTFPRRPKSRLQPLNRALRWNLSLRRPMQRLRRRLNRRHDRGIGCKSALLFHKNKSVTSTAANSLLPLRCRPANLFITYAFQ